MAEAREFSTIHEAAGGSLSGRLTFSDDWDSDEVNDAIAADFGLDG